MLLWVAFLTFFGASLYWGYRVGFRVVWLLALAGAGLLGGCFGLYVVLTIEKATPRSFADLDVELLRSLLLTPMPAVGGFAFVSATWFLFWVRTRRLPLNLHPAPAAVRFASDAALSDALDCLEDRVRVKYLPGDPIRTDTILTYEAWAEILEEARFCRSYSIVPFRAAVHLVADSDAKKRVELANRTNAVILVREDLASAGPVALPASNSKFCREVLGELAALNG